MTKATLTILFAFVLATMSLAARAADQHPTSTTHDTHEAHDTLHDTIIAPPDGERWPTDEPLRTGMSRIQSAVEQSTATAPLSRERSVALAGAIEQDVTYIIEHCKLPPKPDAALHVLIARILTGTHQLQQDDSSEAAIAQIQGALRDYRDTFDHQRADSPHQH